MKSCALVFVRHRKKLSLELKLLMAVAALAMLATAGPFVSQPSSYHDFADQRVLWQLPFAMDVLSNLAFAAWGAICIGLAWPWPRLGHVAREASSVQGNMALLFAVGLLITTSCSGWYHLHLSDAGLAIDRVGMVFAFAGLLGLAAGGRAGTQAGLWLAACVLLFGPLSVLAWSLTGNVTPWLVLQFGGLALLVWFACLDTLEGALPIRWSLVIMFYAAAKCMELADYNVYEWTGHVLSGHSLKHVVASCAAWPVVSALLQQRTHKGLTGSP